MGNNIIFINIIIMRINAWDCKSSSVALKGKFSYVPNHFMLVMFFIELLIIVLFGFVTDYPNAVEEETEVWDYTR